MTDDASVQQQDRQAAPKTNGRHIAFMVNHFPIASEIFIMNAAAELGRRDVQLDIIGASGIGPLNARSIGSDSPAQDVEAELAANPRITVRGPRHYYHRRNRWLSIPTMLTTLLRTRGPAVTARVLGMSRTLGGSRFVAQAHAVCNARYDAVHCHFGTLGPLALDLRKAGVMDAPIVVHFRGYDISQYVQENGVDVYDRVFREADWFIANCAAFRDRAVALGCDPEKIDIVSSGADLRQFPYVDRTSSDDGAIRLLAIGRLVDKKGFALAIEAVRQLMSDGMAVRLEIVGEGPLRGEFERTIAEHRLQDSVSLTGALPHSAIAERLNRSDVLLAPSITAPSGDSDAPVNTIKEAMATGAAVIGSRHGGIPEIIDHGVNGLLFDEGNAGDLATRIRTLAADPELRNRMGVAGRATVERGHSLDRSTEQFLTIYDRVAR